MGSEPSVADSRAGSRSVGRCGSNGLDQALRLLTRCSEAYRKATEAERRLLNLGLFSDIWVTDDTATMSLASPFRELMSLPLTGEARAPRATAGAKREAANRQGSDTNKPALLGSAGLKVTTLVPPTGFEPALPP